MLRLDYHCNPAVTPTTYYSGANGYIFSVVEGRIGTSYSVVEAVVNWKLRENP